jgi:hypothetical protein
MPAPGKLARPGSTWVLRGRIGVSGMVISREARSGAYVNQYVTRQDTLISLLRSISTLIEDQLPGDRSYCPPTLLFGAAPPELPPVRAIPGVVDPTTRQSGACRRLCLRFWPLTARKWAPDHGPSVGKWQTRPISPLPRLPGLKPLSCLLATFTNDRLRITC